MALVVGFIVVSVLLPIFELNEIIRQRWLPSHGSSVVHYESFFAYGSPLGVTQKQFPLPALRFRRYLSGLIATLGR